MVVRIENQSESVNNPAQSRCEIGSTSKEKFLSCSAGNVVDMMALDVGVD